MFAKGKRRGAAVLALAAMLAGIGMSLVPAGSAEAGWRGRGYGYYGGYRPIYRPYPYYGGYYGYRSYNPGAAVAAGVFGLAAGAIIGSALTQPRYYSYPSYPAYQAPAPVYVAPQTTYGPRGLEPYDASLPARSGTVSAGYAPAQGSSAWYAYCASKYRSFDARSGTYLGYDGQRHYCR